MCYTASLKSVFSFYFFSFARIKSFYVFFFFLELQVDFLANEVRPIKKLLATFKDLATLTNLIGYCYEMSYLGLCLAVERMIRESLV